MQPVTDIRREHLMVEGHVVVADVHLRRGDDRPPVVFLHGIMASLDLVGEVFVDPDAESWISISLPGHHPGRLAPGCDTADLDEALFARLHGEAIRQVVGDRAVIAAGWSTGGCAALNLAIRHPARVAAVASLAGFASGKRIAGLMRLLAWLAGVPVGRLAFTTGLRTVAAWPALYAAFLGELAADQRAAARLPKALVGRMHRAFGLHDPGSLATVLAALRSLDITDRLGEIAVPAWIAGGARDPAVPLSETRRIAAAIPHATLQVYAGAGHLFFSEWAGVRGDFANWRGSLGS